MKCKQNVPDVLQSISMDLSGFLFLHPHQKHVHECHERLMPRPLFYVKCYMSNICDFIVKRKKLWLLKNKELMLQN